MGRPLSISEPSPDGDPDVEALRAWIVDNSISVTDIASRLGVPQSTVSNWLIRRHKPSRAARSLIRSILPPS